MNLKTDNTYYRIILEQNGTTVQEYSNIIITSSTITLTNGGSASGDYWNYVKDDLAVSCSVTEPTNTTASISCTFNDASGMMSYAKLTVNELFAISNSTVCESELYSTSGTLLCTVNTTNKVLKYELLTRFPNLDYIAYTDILDYATSGRFGNEGLVGALLIFLASVGIGRYRPEVGIIFGIIGLSVSSYIGLINVGYAALMSLAAIVGIIVLKGDK